MKILRYTYILYILAMMTACSRGVEGVTWTTETLCDTLLTDKDKSMMCWTSASLTLLTADTLSPYYAHAERINRFIIDELMDGCQGAASTKAAQQFVAESNRSMAEEMLTLYGANGGDLAPVFSNRLTTEAHWGYDDEVVCYTMDIDSYTGGAHPVALRHTRCFSLRSGEVVKPEDVFRWEMEDSLVCRLTRRLMEMTGLNSMEELRESGYLDVSDMFVTSNMLLEQDAIVFHYNPYELAPYALGDIDIRLTYDEVKDLLIEN